MIKKIFQRTGLLFILYVSLCYIYALMILNDPELGNNIYNLIQEYSKTVRDLMPMYIIMIISFFIGWKLIFRKSKKSISFTHKVLNIKKVKSIGFFSSFILLCISIILLYVVYGTGILYRDTYHPKDLNYTFLIVYKILTLFLIILIYISQKINKFNKFLLLFAILFFSLGIGSRISAIYLLLIFLMYLFTNKNIKFVNISLYLISIIFLIIFVQYSRGLEEQGLLGIIKYTDFSEIFKIYNLISYYVTAFSIFVTAATYKSYLNVSNLNDFIIMLNPMPGYFAGWYNINSTMRVMPVVPYSSVGTIFTLGYLGTFIFYLLLGMLVGYIDNYIQKAIQYKKYLLAITIWAFMVLFIIFHNQYTLRTSMRFIYYSIFIIFIVFIYKLLKKEFRKVKKNVYK